MLPAILVSLITTVVPLLVGHAEETHPEGSGDRKHAYVEGAVKNLISYLKKKTPDWVDPSMDEVGKLVDQLIETKLDEIDP